MGESYKRVLVKKIATVAAASIIAVLSVRNEACARGSGGSHRGGKVTSSWRLPNGYRHNRYKNRFSNLRHDSHRKTDLDRQTSRPPNSQGEWRSSSAFGSHNQKPSHIQDEWQESPGFGSQEKSHKSANSHRPGHTGGNPKGANGNCQESDAEACQGEWREIPEP